MGGSLGDLLTWGFAVGLCVLIWFGYRDYSQRQERQASARLVMEKERDEADRAARERESQRQVELESERRRQKELEINECRRQEEIKRQAEAEARRLNDTVLRAKEEADQAARAKLEAKELQAHQEVEQRHEQELADEREKARAQAILAVNSVENLAAESVRLDALAKSYRNNAFIYQTSLKSLQTQFQQLSQNAPTRGGNVHGVSIGAADTSQEIARLQGKVDSASRSVAEARNHAMATERELAATNTRLTDAVAAKDAAEKRLRDLGIALDPTTPVPVRAYTVVVLNDGRRLSAVSVQVLENIISIKQENGKFVTIKKTDVKEVIKPELVLPSGH